MSLYFSLSLLIFYVGNAKPIIIYAFYNFILLKLVIKSFVVDISLSLSVSFAASVVLMSYSFALISLLLGSSMNNNCYLSQKAYVIHWVRLDRYSSAKKAYDDGIKRLETLVTKVQDIDP